MEQSSAVGYEWVAAGQGLPDVALDFPCEGFGQVGVCRASEESSVIAPDIRGGREDASSAPVVDRGWASHRSSYSRHPPRSIEFLKHFFLHSISLAALFVS